MRNSAAAAREAHRELEIGEIGAPVGAAQPVLLLGEIVVADAGAMQLAQAPPWRSGNRRASPCGLAMCSAHAVDPAAHQRLLRREQQRRRDRRARPRPQARGVSRVNRWRASAKLHHGTSSIRRSTASTSPSGVAKAAALHGREHVALEHDARRASARSISRGRAIGVIPRRRRGRRRRSSARDRRARGAVSARFLASVLAVPRSRLPSGPRSAPARAAGTGRN